MLEDFQLNNTLESSWKSILLDELESDYFTNLKSFLKEEYNANNIFPEVSLIFHALNLTPFKHVKVIILGQDPYHGERQANGLCFSVNKGEKIPPSLNNIYKELKQDLGIPIPEHGDLAKWAKQGVLLLNTTLTVRKGEAGSHHNKGWERFTDAIIQKLNTHKSSLVFILWGRKAQEKTKFVNQEKHFVLKAAHPSPFSAFNGFLGCKHFSKTNKRLRDIGQKPINWKV